MVSGRCIQVSGPNCKKHHGFKYQAIITLDGLVMSLFGPFEGKANDNRMAQETDIDGCLAALFR